METKTDTEHRGLNIACDDCPRTARYRSESKAAAGYAVRWSCADHRVTA